MFAGVLAGVLYVILTGMLFYVYSSYARQYDVCACRACASKSVGSGQQLGHRSRFLDARTPAHPPVTGFRRAPVILAGVPIDNAINMSVFHPRTPPVLPHRPAAIKSVRFGMLVTYVL